MTLETSIQTRTRTHALEVRGRNPSAPSLFLFHARDSTPTSGGGDRTSTPRAESSLGCVLMAGCQMRSRTVLAWVLLSLVSVAGMGVTFTSAVIAAPLEVRPQASTINHAPCTLHPAPCTLHPKR